MSAVIPHSPFHTPRSTILRQSSIYDIVWMTAQHVTVTTKWKCSSVHFRQHYAQMHHAARKRRVRRRGTLQQNSKYWQWFSCWKSVNEVQEGIHETPGRPIRSILQQCLFIFNFLCPNMRTFSCNVQRKRRRPIPHRYVVIYHTQENDYPHNTPKEKWHARAIPPLATSSRSALNTTPTSKWHRPPNMEFHTLCSWYWRLSTDESMEEVADPSSSEMLTRTITERDTSPRSGDKLSLDAECMSSRSSWTGTVLRPSNILSKLTWCSQCTVSSLWSSHICCPDVILGAGSHVFNRHTNHPLPRNKSSIWACALYAASPFHDYLHHFDRTLIRRGRRHRRVHISPQCTSIELSPVVVPRYLETNACGQSFHKEPFKMLSIPCPPQCSTEKPSG